MAKYVKLGSKSTIFYDPTTNTKVLPGMVLKLSGTGRFSKKITSALKGGHLESADKEEYEEWLSKQEEVDKQSTDKDLAKAADDENWLESYESYDEDSLKALTKDKLIELAIYNESTYSEKELKSMNKSELVEEITSLLEEEE